MQETTKNFDASDTGGTVRFASLMAALLGATVYVMTEAHATPPAVASARSFSGQFIVPTVANLDLRSSAWASTNKDLIQLEPTLLTVSCERIKQLVYRELGASAAWRGKIFLGLYLAQSAQQPVTIMSERFSDGWQYRIELPHLVERERYVRTIVQTLLLEMANRSSWSSMVVS